VAANDRPLNEVRLEQALAAHLPPGKCLQLRLTDNRYTIVSVRRQPDLYAVRVHRMFAQAEPRLVRALARYVVHNDRRASDMLGDFIEQHEHEVRKQPCPPREVTLRPKGRAYDLQAIFDRLNRRYFSGKLDARITWGNAVRKKNRRSIKMGSFSVEDRIIRIHPVLDDADVPEFVVAWIVFHEMLHGKHEVRRVHGRRCFHSREFAEEERAFEDYERACTWEREHSDRLFAS
jgi:predicted metal-dependent hydrolase